MELIFATIGILIIIFLTLLASILVLLVLWYLKFQIYDRHYWRLRHVPYSVPKFLAGNTGGANVELALFQALENIYVKSKPDPVHGIWLFISPVLIINDVNLIKKILVTDFSYFHDRGFPVNKKLEPFSEHLFNMSGQEWRNLRAKLTPTFTSGKMKLMIPLLLECCDNLQTVLRRSAEGGRCIEIKEVLARYTTDTISSCAFGINSNSLHNEHSEFRHCGQLLTKPRLLYMITRIVNFLLPEVSKYIPIRQVDPEVHDFLMESFKSTINYRETNNVNRSDFLDILLSLLRNGVLGRVEEAAAQAFVFFFAGFETSSTVMLYALYELALSDDIRCKCQKEVDKMIKKHGGQLSDEALHEMLYLDQVMQESLRKYHPVPMLFRICTEDYQVPDSNITIAKGERLLIPVAAIQKDPQYFPEPEKFDPDRFTPEGKAGRDHYLHLPFGEGPRICIGARFGLLQAKIGLASIISKFEFTIQDQVPKEFDPQSFFPSPKDGLHLKFRARK